MDNEKMLLSTDEMIQKWAKEAQKEEKALWLLGGISLATFFVADAIYLVQLYDLLQGHVWQILRDSSFLAFCLSFVGLLAVSIESTIKIRFYINKNRTKAVPSRTAFILYCPA